MLLEQRRRQSQEPDSEPPDSSSRIARGGAKKRSRVAINIATVVVTVGFSYIALSDVRLGQMWHALRTSDYWWLLPALGVFALGNVARALRWRSLFTPGRRPSFGVTFNAMMIGYLYNNILPARAGEAARVLVLTRRGRTPAVEILGTVALERLYDVVGVLVIFFAAEPWLPHVSWFKAAAIAAIALAAAIAGVAGMLARYGDRPLRLLLRPLRRLSLLAEERLERTVVELAHGLSGLRNGRVATEAFLWTAAAWMLTALCSYLVMFAFHLHLSLASGVLVSVAIGLGMILPAPPAAVGVFEGAAIIALKAYGLSKSSSLPYALVLHAVNFFPFVAIGALLLHYNVRHPPQAPEGDIKTDDQQLQPA
jgi:uncharacterized protein (TIRG00374 family)